MLITTRHCIGEEYWRKAYGLNAKSNSPSLYEMPWAFLSFINLVQVGLLNK